MNDRDRGDRHVIQPMIIGEAPGKVPETEAARRSEELVAALLDVAGRCSGAKAGTCNPEAMLEAVDAVAKRLKRREIEFAEVARIAERVNLGLSLDDALAFAYRELHSVIPYNRIGFSLVDEEHSRVWSRWSQSDRERKLGEGFACPLKGSTLQTILETGRPRIINNLEEYLAGKPQSKSTALIVAEGMRSSLTCPLIVRGKPVGFMFFSSAEKGTYSDAHVAFFLQIAGILAAVLEKSRLYQELDESKAVIQVQNDAMTRDLELARQVQRALIPAEAPDLPGLEVAFQYEPAIQVGGDCLDVVPGDDGRVVFFVADAMGHGVQAALVVSVIKTALRNAAERDASPAHILGEVNRALVNLLGFSFVTAACALVDADARTAEIALAGHQPPLWFHAESGEVTQPGISDLPLGVSKSPQYASSQIELSRGDALLLLTDGIIEAMNPSGEQFGISRICDRFAALAPGDVDTLLDTLRRELADFSAGRDVGDDLTMLAVKVPE